jgi:hypothetical protein
MVGACGLDRCQVRDQWRALVNTVMNLWVPWMDGNFLPGCGFVSFSRLPHGVDS